MSGEIGLPFLEPNALFAGKYRVLRRLGGGGVGDVYLVDQPVLDRQLALKLLKPEALKAPGMKELFVQEARISGAVGSAHIVQVFDAGVDEQSGAPFLVMELLQGRDLQRIVEED